MKHDEIEAYLSGYIDGELTEGEKLRALIHMGNCANCRATVQELRNTREAVRQLSIKSLQGPKWRKMRSLILERIRSRALTILVSAQLLASSVDPDYLLVSST